MKLRRRAGARRLVFICDAVNWFRTAVFIDGWRTGTRPFGRIVAEHRVVTRIGRSIDFRCVLGARSFFGSKASLLSAGWRNDKNYNQESQQDWEPQTRWILAHRFTPVS